MNDINSSDYRSKAWTAQNPAWIMTQDMWMDALYIRHKQTEYLEKFKKEVADKYIERLNRSVFTNEFKNCIETFAGMALKKDPRPDTAPKLIEELYTDIDGCGNSLHQFLIKAFEMYLRDGDAHILIDAPPAPERGDAPLTLSDRQADRPFWVLYSASQLISKREETIGGKQVLVQAVIEEKTLEPDGLYGEKEVTRHRILRRGSYVIEVKNDKQEFVVESEGPALEDIPLVSFGNYGDAPPLLVLAMLNKQYYNKISDFDDWCHLACVPRMVLKFDDESQGKAFDELNQSAGVGIKVVGENAEAKWLEVTGSGLEIASNRNAEVKAQMSEIGINLLAPTEVANESATKTLDTAGQRQSKLARYAREFENGIEKAFYFTALQWNQIRGANAVDLKEVENNALKLNTDFERLTFSPEQLQVFKDMVASGNLSRETFWDLLRNVVDFPPDWDPEVEKARLAAQQAAMDAIIMEDAETSQAAGAGR